MSATLTSCSRIVIVAPCPHLEICGDMQVYVDECLTHDEQIAFNADSHTEMIRLAYRDFEALVQPKILQLQ